LLFHAVILAETCGDQKRKKGASHAIQEFLVALGNLDQGAVDKGEARPEEIGGLARLPTFPFS
jgi:hypothetical protein